MVVLCVRCGDIALLAGILRPKRRYEPSFGPFFGLWGCRFDALHDCGGGVGGGGVGCSGGDRWLASRGEVMLEVVEVSLQLAAVVNMSCRYYS